MVAKERIANKKDRKGGKRTTRRVPQRDGKEK